MKQRRKTWAQKVKITRDCYIRCKDQDGLSAKFYENLFFLNPKLRDYFKETDWNHQHRALMHALENLFNFFNEENSFHKMQVLRIAGTHSKQNLNIHPHHYYYWIDALIMTFKEVDPKWNDNMAYYLRECLFFPISFIISRYNSGEK